MISAHTYAPLICSYSDLSDYGWYMENEELKVVWESPENLQQVQRTVEYLMQGCKCKTGCITRRCKCKKQTIQCGPSCHCINCNNTPSFVSQPEQELQAEQDDQTDSEDTSDKEMSSDEESVDELNREVDMIMEEVFGVPF